MKKIIAIFIFQLLIVPFGLSANENYSVEIEALTLVMEKHKKETLNDPGKDLESNNSNNKPSYMALKQDECNATVKVTEKTGLEIVGTKSFYVNICKKEVNKVLN